MATPDDAFLRVRGVFGGGPFAEVGEARVVADDVGGVRIAVAGSLGSPQWFGHDVASTSGPSAWHRLGIYRADTLRCTHLVRLHWPVNTVAFHPELPLVAIGSGAYDGGWLYEGELTLLNLDTGRSVSVLDEEREVTRVAWRDGHTLDLVMPVRGDEEADELGTFAVTTAITSGGWTTLGPGSVRVADLPTAATARACDADIATAEAVLGAYASAVGRRRVLRRQVWAVAALPDGRILAGLENVAAECWTGEGERVWSLPTPGMGCQIAVDAAGRSAVVADWTGRWQRPRVMVERVDLLDGLPEPVRTLDHPAVLVAGEDGWLALRDCDLGSAPRPTLVIAPDGDPTAEVDLGGYDLFNHFFDIRRAPGLLFLQGTGERPHEGKWVVGLDAARRTVERLFPLEWDAGRGRHIFGGPGVFVTDAGGAAIVHGCAIYDGRGLLPGNACVVRRSFPDGRAGWVHTADHQVTAVDAVGEVVCAALNSGEVIALRAGDGRLVGRQRLTVDGHPVVPLSLSAVAPDRIVIGTMDGRVLVCRIGAPDSRIRA